MTNRWRGIIPYLVLKTTARSRTEFLITNLKTIKYLGLELTSYNLVNGELLLDNKRMKIPGQTDGSGEDFLSVVLLSNDKIQIVTDRVSW